MNVTMCFPSSDPHARAAQHVADFLRTCGCQLRAQELASLISVAAGQLAALNGPFALSVLENTAAALKRGGA